MSDETIPQSVQNDIDNIVKTTKKGFDLTARLKGRGLRKSSIFLFLDDNKGVEYGWAQDVRSKLDGSVLARSREGVVGELDIITSSRDATLAAYEDAVRTANAFKKDVEDVEGEIDLIPKIPAPDFPEVDARIAELSAKRDALLAELKGSALLVKMTAVPPVIHKDMRRRARDTLGLTEKGIPADQKEEFELAHTAHLMTVMISSITDQATGEINTGTTYDDAIALINYLSPGQFARLDLEMGKVQFTDAISRDIEAQEDFS